MLQRRRSHRNECARGFGTALLHTVHAGEGRYGCARSKLQGRNGFAQRRNPTGSSTGRGRSMSEWEEAQKEGLSFWGDCSDTYGEETKQLVYMRKRSFRPTSK